MPRYTMKDGEQLYVREIGQGQPVLVLSGLGMQSWQWLPFIATHLKTFKFIIPDWRGFGGSQHCKIPQDLNAIQSHWQDTECLIQQFDLNDFILMGYSMGATTAMHGMQYGDLAIKLKAYLHIDQTPKISTDDTWAHGLLGTKHPEFKGLLSQISVLLHHNKQHQQLKKLDSKEKQKLIDLWLAFISLQALDQTTPKVFKVAFNVPHLQNYLMPIQRLDYLSWYINSYLNHAEDYRDTVAKLEAPSTFFIGEQSTLYPSEGQLKIAESVKNTHHVIFKKSGHALLMTEPVKFSREITKFLNAYA